MKFVTLLTRLFPLGLLDCCLPAATNPAPGGSLWGFGKNVLSRFSQANIIRSKKPSDQPARQETSQLDRASETKQHCYARWI